MRDEVEKISSGGGTTWYDIYIYKGWSLIEYEEETFVVPPPGAVVTTNYFNITKVRRRDIAFGHHMPCRYSFISITGDKMKCSKCDERMPKEVRINLIHSMELLKMGLKDDD